jgi:DNA recombination protein RmuC
MCSLRFLQGAKEEMTNQFKLLGQEIVAQHGACLKKQNIEQLNGLLTPLQQKLSDFQQQLATTQTENNKERAAFGEQIRAVLNASASMSSEANNLTQALKGNSQTQGAGVKRNDPKDDPPSVWPARRRRIVEATS